MKKILFYIAQDYYWPSLKPVYEAFEQAGGYELHVNVAKNSKRYLGVILISQRARLEAKYREQGYVITRETTGFDAVFCGAQLKNPHRFGDALLCNVDHGPGIKTLRYRHFLKQPDTQYICFLEGQYRLDKFRKYGLDKIEKLYGVGLPKLDVFFNGQLNREQIITEMGLDPKRKNVLYAPSYKPTSIFLIGEQILALSDKYNIIVKLHPYSWSGRYAPHSQHRLFENLQQRYPGMYLVPEAQHDILPFMFAADTLISDGSSVINEFLALGRCGIIFDLPDEELTHHDGQPLLEDKSADWLKDSFIHINEQSDLTAAIEEALNPSQERLERIEQDKKYIFSYTDGQSANRVVEQTTRLLEQKHARNL